MLVMHFGNTIQAEIRHVAFLTYWLHVLHVQYVVELRFRENHYYVF